MDNLEHRDLGKAGVLRKNRMPDDTGTSLKVNMPCKWNPIRPNGGHDGGP